MDGMGKVVPSASVRCITKYYLEKTWAITELCSVGNADAFIAQSWLSLCDAHVTRPVRFVQLTGRDALMLRRVHLCARGGTVSRFTHSLSSSLERIVLGHVFLRHRSSRNLLLR